MATSRNPLRQNDNENYSNEQQALEVLRAHREQSGYIPWPKDDNERLRAFGERQKKELKAGQDFREGLKIYNQKVEIAPPYFETLSSVLSQITPAPPEPEKPPLEVRVDPELGRLAVALGKTSAFRLWCTARHFFGNPGWATRAELYDRLRASGVINTKRHFNRLLKDGEGLFWGLAADGRVWLRGYVKVSLCLTQRAAQTSPDLVATNIPGVRDVYLDVTGDIGDFKARVYAGWLTYRQAPKIARDTLCALFGCTQDTLRNWEERLGDQIEIITNYAQTAIDPKDDEQIVDYLPDHCYAYVTRRGQIRLRWRQPNRYNPQHFREHPHKGQSRKARTAAAVAAWYQPVEICAHMEKLPFDRSHRVSRRYFENAESLRKWLKRLEKRGQAGATPETPRYVYRGKDHNGHGIYEVSLDGEVRTTAWERMPIRREYGWWAGFRAWRESASLV